MIPAITPPTDNLYKFISLFGLTILLFSIYNLGFVFDHSSDNKVKIEDIKVLVAKKMYQKVNELSSGKQDSVRERFRPSSIRKLGEDLASIEKVVMKSNLSPVEIIELNGRMKKLEVKLDSLWQKQLAYIFFAFLGFVVMIIGFLRWNKKEQRLRDKILHMEYLIKIEERRQQIETE